MPKPQRKWEKQKPKRLVTPRESVLGQVKQHPRTPRNVVRRPLKLPAVRPLTDRDREAA